MESNTELYTSTGSVRASARDFFLNLGAVVALYTVVFSLLNLLFTIIDSAYPPITNGYGYYYGSQSISWPVSILIIFFPILILLMWILEREFTKEPDRKNILIRKWLSYITLFIAGATLAGDLVMVLYYFIDGQALTTGFLLKVLSVLVVSVCVFLYYISDIRDRLTSFSRKIWRVVAFVIVAGSIVWGFSVLGSPHTQRLLKYDEQKINDLMNINSQVTMHYELKGFLPTALSDLISLNNYSFMPVDQQTGKAYEYKLLGQSARAYELCAEFNKASNDKGNQTTAMKYPYGDVSWTHGSGRYCFERAVDTNMYPKSAR